VDCGLHSIVALTIEGPVGQLQRNTQIRSQHLRSQHLRSQHLRSQHLRSQHLRSQHFTAQNTMEWLRLVGSLKLQDSFAKEPYERDYILQKRPIILRSLLIIATPYESLALEELKELS